MSNNKRKADYDLQQPQQEKKQRTSQWLTWANKLAEVVKVQEQAEEDAQVLFARSDALSMRRAVQLDPRTDIMNRIAKLRKTYNDGFTSWYYQDVLFDSWLAVSMRWWVGDNFECYKPFILRELGREELELDTHVVMGRQAGKTRGMCRTAAVSSVHIPRRNCLFSPGKRNSEQDMRLIQEDVRQMIPQEQWKDRIIVANGERLVVRVDPLDNTVTTPQYSETRCFPQNADSKSKRFSHNTSNMIP